MFLLSGTYQTSRDSGWDTLVILTVRLHLSLPGGIQADFMEEVALLRRHLSLPLLPLSTHGMALTMHKCTE